MAYAEYLVGGWPTPLKNDGVRQWSSDDIPYMKWKIKAMFQTTNQLLLSPQVAEIEAVGLRLPIPSNSSDR